MKTPAQILNAHTPLGLGYHSSWIVKAMKEYAKQWVERAAEVENRTEYMTDGEWILRLKEEIDAQ